MAVYSKECLTSVERAITGKKRRPVEFLASVRTREVSEDELCPIDPELLSIFNINTPKDYKKALEIISEWDDNVYRKPHKMVEKLQNHLL